MPFVDSERAGKRLVVWTDSNGGATRIKPLPPQENKHDYEQITSGGKVIYAGEAVNKGYITYQELKEMFPRFTPEQLEDAGVAKPAVHGTKRRKTKMREQTFITRWGLTNEVFPRWQPLSDHGKTREHTKDYLQVEERRMTFQVAIGEDDQEMLLSCTKQEYVPYRHRVQDIATE